MGTANDGFVLAIDQGTISSRAILFDGQQKIVGIAQQEFQQYFPKSGWVEHDPEEIWTSVVTVCRNVLSQTTLMQNELRQLVLPISAKRR